MNQRKGGTILSYIYILISNIVSLLYTPFMLNMLGQSEYGLYGTANSFTSYLSILGFGIGGAYIRFNAQYRAKKDRDGENRLNGMFLMVFSGLSLLVLIGGIILIILAGILTQNTFTEEELFKLRVIIALLTLNTMGTFVSNVIMMALQAYEQFIFIRSVLIGAALLTPIANIVVLFLGGKAIAISAISVIISLLTYVLYYIYARAKIDLKFCFRGFDWNVIKEIFIFSSFLFINSITDQITSSTDSVVLSAVKGTVSVAIYTVGASFVRYFSSFASVVAGVFAPQVNQSVALKEDISKLDYIFIKIGRIQFYIVSLILIGYSSIGGQFVIVWAGQDYSESFWIGLILIISAFIPCIQSVGVEIQKAFNKHKVRSIVYLFVALANIALTIPFAQWWAGIGAAVATLLCVVLGQVIFMNIYYYKSIRLNIPAFWRSILSILPGYILPCLTGFLINRFWKLDSLVEILVAAIIIAGVFCISVWLISMNRYERDLFIKPLKRGYLKLKNRL